MIKKDKYIVLFYAYKKKIKRSLSRIKPKAAKNVINCHNGLHNPFEKL